MANSRYKSFSEMAQVEVLLKKMKSIKVEPKDQQEIVRLSHRINKMLRLWEQSESLYPGTFGNFCAKIVYMEHLHKDGKL